MEINAGTVGFSSFVLGCLGFFKSYDTFKISKDRIIMGKIMKHKEKMQEEKQSKGIDTSHIYIPIAKAEFLTADSDPVIKLTFENGCNCPGYCRGCINNERITMIIPSGHMINHASEKQKMDMFYFGCISKESDYGLLLKIPSSLKYGSIVADKTNVNNKIHLIQDTSRIFYKSNDLIEVQDKFDEVANSLENSSIKQGLFSIGLMLGGISGMIYHNTK